MTIPSEISGRAIKVISEVLRIDPGKILPGHHLKNDLGAQSLDQITLLMELETEFGKSMPDEEAAHLQTVSEIIEYIEQKHKSA